MGFQMLCPNTSAGKIGLEQETADLFQNIAAWLPHWAAVSSSACLDLASVESWKSIGLDLNGSRTKPYSDSFIHYVSDVRASIMQRGEK